MIPGPTNVDPEVLRALSRPTLSHVSERFADLLRETIKDLGAIFQTDGLILPLAGSGTLGAEVALANIIEPGNKVLLISNGYFADWLGDIAGTLGAVVDKYEIPWGSAANPSNLEAKLRANRYKALLAVHVNTSTGAANPIEEIGRIARKYDSLFVLDAICSLGGMDVQVDRWGIDACFTGSQKALAIPPGLAVISFSARAIASREERKNSMSTYYGDVKRWLPVLQEPSKYFATPPVNIERELQDDSEGRIDQSFRSSCKNCLGISSRLEVDGTEALMWRRNVCEHDDSSTLS